MTPDAALRRDVEIILGRVNALHAFCMTLAGTLSSETLAATAQAMRESIPKVEADALASPIAEATLQEMLRVMTELQAIAHANSRLPPP